MDLTQLRCFVAVAEELHFGRAAQRLGMMPAALGRQIRRLEEDLRTRLLNRTTRIVTLTDSGALLLDDARALLAQADALARRLRDRSRRTARTLRLGAIDTAAASLVPALLHDFRGHHPDIAVELVEDKTIRLLPRLLSGRLDLAIVRPPAHPDPRLALLPLLHETPVVAVPAGHRLARRRRIAIADLAAEPVIVPDRRSRPHSHDLTMTLFERAGLRPTIAQVAEEKQTILGLVAAGLGVAIVPRWTSKAAVRGVRHVALAPADGADLLPLSAAWVRDARDPARDALLAVLTAGLPGYGADA